MAASAEYDGTDVQFYTIPTFTFITGTTLHDLKVAYRSYNPSSTAGVILIPTCYGGLVNTTLAFSSAPYDALSKYHVIVAAMLGNGESDSPSNKQFFPEPGYLRYADCIKAYHELLTKHLGIRELEAVVGFSMGAQQAYHLAVMYPDFVKRAVPICGSARTSPHNYAFLEGPIGGLTNAIDYVAWREMKAKVARGEDVGVNLKQVRPRMGLKTFGRSYSAWLTSAEWFDEGWWGMSTEEGGMGAGSVEEWVQGAEGRFENGWDAEDLLVLAKMWQAGDIGDVIPGEEKVKDVGHGLKVRAKEDDERFQKALGSIKAKVLVMPCRSDQYFRPSASEYEVKYLKQGKLCVIESVWGHVAGGGLNPKDVEFMNEKIGEFMKE